MISILKAFRDALIDDATLHTLIPEANIYAGLRDEKTDIPAIDIFQIPGAPDEKYAGARVGGMTKADVVIQVSVFARTDIAAWTIADQVQAIVLADNETLNTAKIKNITMIGGNSLREANTVHIPLIHIPLRFQLNYHYIS